MKLLDDEGMRYWWAKLKAYFAPKSHAAGDATYGAATGQLYGHVLLVDQVTNIGASSGRAASPYSVWLARSQAMESCWPVGSVYWNTADVSPATVLGFGAWIPLDAQLLCDSGSSVTLYAWQRMPTGLWEPSEPVDVIT